MNLEGDNDNRIINYLNGLMSEDEAHDFEAQCRMDPELNEMVELMKQMDDVLDHHDWHRAEANSEKLKETAQLFTNKDALSFSDNLRLAEVRHRNQRAKKSRWRRLKYVSAIASIVLIAFFFNYFYSSDISAVGLFNDYYSNQDMPSFIVKSDDTKAIIEAENLFKEEQYAKALPLFEAANISSKNENPSVLIYLSLTHLFLENYDKAIQYLDILEKSNTIDFHKAYWFKSLIYLKQDNKEEALKNLNKIMANTTYFNYQKAKKLRDALD